MHIKRALLCGVLASVLPQSVVEARVSALMASVGGAYIDPQDAATRYQENTGQTSTTAAGQTIGTLLDKRLYLALGPEVVTNGVFNDASGWTLVSGSEVSEGKLRLSVPSTNTTSAFSVETGKRYKWAIQISEYVSGTLNFSFGGSTRVSTALVGDYGGISTATISTTSARILSSGSPIAAVDNITIREQLGNHASQAASSSRPKLQTGPTRVAYDTIDDFLTTTFPSALGSDCTIVRAIPSVGAAILTAQTIGTTFNDDQDHCGLLIINRALTASETALVRQWANFRSFS